MDACITMRTNTNKRADKKPCTKILQESQEVRSESDHPQVAEGEKGAPQIACCDKAHHEDHCEDEVRIPSKDFRQESLA